MKADAAISWSQGSLGSGLAGRNRLLFGRMYEDPAIERRIFAPGSRLCCIASAGCVALALSGDYRVTAVDVNPLQIEYARSRAAGGPSRLGEAEKILQAGRCLAQTTGWTRPKLERFLDFDTVEEQLGYWRTELRTWRFEEFVHVVLSRPCLRLAYSETLLSSLPERFDQVVLGRIERGLAVHPNRGNPFARLLFLGPPRSQRACAAGPIEFVCADAADYLERCPAGSFDGFSLSNILDGASPAYRERLLAAVRRAGRPNSRCLLRSFSEPDEAATPTLAGADRCLLWGHIEAPALGD